jgi:hypothetical protein
MVLAFLKEFGPVLAKENVSHMFNHGIFKT